MFVTASCEQLWCRPKTYGGVILLQQHKHVFSKAYSSSVHPVCYYSLSHSDYATLLACRCTIGLNVALMVLFLSLSVTFFLLAAGQENMRCLKVSCAPVLFCLAWQHVVVTMWHNCSQQPTLIYFVTCDTAETPFLHGIASSS